MQLFSIIFAPLLFSFLAPKYLLANEEILSLERYLAQMEERSLGFKAAEKTEQAGLFRSFGARTLFAPNFFANISFKDDYHYGPARFFNFDSMSTSIISLGVSQQFDFGLEAKLHYDYFGTSYKNPVLSPALGNLLSGINTSYYNAGPVLELSQALWANGFGRSVKAQSEMSEAESLASNKAASFELKSRRIQAEILYWNLAANRELVSLGIEALDRAEKILAYNRNKARLHLTEEADVLQAEAMVQGRKMELLTYKNLERKTAQEFNLTREINSDEVSEQLLSLAPELLDGLSIPVPGDITQREDLQSAAQMTRMKRAKSVVAHEQTLPFVELYASFSLNSQKTDSDSIPKTTSTALSQSFSFARPTEEIGIRIKAPLNLTSLSKVRQGHAAEAQAADWTYERKLFETQNQWKDLETTLKESQEHFALSRELESIQHAKLDLERSRLHKGRSTTYQILLFEQDYLASQLSRVRDQTQILITVAQMKLFSSKS